MAQNINTIANGKNPWKRIEIKIVVERIKKRGSHHHTENLKIVYDGCDNKKWKKNYITKYTPNNGVSFFVSSSTYLFFYSEQITTFKHKGSEE